MIIEFTVSLKNEMKRTYEICNFHPADTDSQAIGSVRVIVHM